MNVGHQLNLPPDLWPSWPFFVRERANAVKQSMLVDGITSRIVYVLAFLLLLCVKAVEDSNKLVGAFS